MQKPPAGDDSVGRMQFLLSLRQRGIMDAAVLRALDEVPREHFVEGPFAESAYADQALPINCGQTISQPYVVAYMTEQLALGALAARGEPREVKRQLEQLQLTPLSLLAPSGDDFGGVKA